MHKLIDFLLSLPSVQARLIELGWTPPPPIEKTGPGPWRPPQ